MVPDDVIYRTFGFWFRPSQLGNNHCAAAVTSAVTLKRMRARCNYFVYYANNFAIRSPRLVVAEWKEIPSSLTLLKFFTECNNFWVIQSK
jgi:hypothetical protein